MDRAPSPVLRRELENLEKDADSRKSAMKALKSYVKDMNLNDIPMFLAAVSEIREAGSSSGEYIISLYEILAIGHGPNIVPHIDDIMCFIVKTLATSAGSIPLQQVCSKAVQAIARYGIEPTNLEGKKRQIIQSLCKPLSDSLLGAQESLSCGAALCLKALVDCDNWRFASDHLVNEVSLKLTGALKEQQTQTNSHMGLVMSLAKRNSFIIEAYARLLIQAGLSILSSGSSERNSQKRLTAIQMVHFLMKCLDIRSIFSELELIIKVMDNCQSDQTRYVRGAALEALETARKMVAEKGSKIENARNDHSRRRFSSSPGDTSSISGSPESETLDSFGEYDSVIDSPISMSQASCNLIRNRRTAYRKTWSYENGGVDVSLGDGFFSEIAHENLRSRTISELDEGSDYNVGGYVDGFGGFGPESAAHEAMRSQTPSPQRSHARTNGDNIDLFTTSRKLVHSHQDPYDTNSQHSGNQTRNFRIPSSSKYNQNGFEVNQNDDRNGDITGGDDETPKSDSESISSTEDDPVEADMKVVREALLGSKPESRKLLESSCWKTAFSTFCIVVLVVFVVLISVFWSGEQDEGFNLVPT